MSLLRVTLALTLVVYVLGAKADNKDFVPTNNKTEAPGEKVLARSARNIKEKLDNLYATSHLIYPGTLWCGKGNISTSYENLGYLKHTDACCREHDHCPVKIEPGKTLDGLINKHFYTISDCKCDIEFLKCLKNVHNQEQYDSGVIGNVYFNVLGPECLSKDHPILYCEKYTALLLKLRCIKYKTNEKEPEKLQFKDKPFF